MSEKNNEERISEGFGQIEYFEDNDVTKVTTKIAKPNETRPRKKNKAKVSLGWVGDTEFYVYPYDFPEKVFFDTHGSQVLDKYSYRKMFGILNRVKCFLNGNWRKKARTTFQKELIEAYNHKMREAMDV